MAWGICTGLQWGHWNSSDLHVFLAHLSQRLKWAIVIAHRLSSVVRPSVVVVVVRKLFTFSTSSPKPLDGFWWNLVGVKYSWSLTSVVVFRPDPPRGGSRAGPKYVTGSPLLLETSSSDRKATTTSRMDSNDLEACGKKCCYFWFHSEVKFWRVFDVFLDFVILPYFNAISMDFYVVKCLIYFYFV